ncbi:diaminopimelate decarboxylase [Vampirovibrio chlorellavorus]|uniref:diaminopimelate decarboxylase n=1 Tax=Vampirovibrio chlorellavorus TaxID=758823 RepID=UPI0026EB4F00|nr:diaminopimelate decarboxylase [Vampirovibrio chlorellavorus]
MSSAFFPGELEQPAPNTSLKPISYTLDDNNQPLVGGVNLVELARTHGTPLFVLDETTIRAAAKAYTQTLAAAYPAASLPLYACKANMNMGLVKLMEQCGMGLDVVSGGELYTAIQAGFPMERVLFNGNNKTAQELELAIHHGIGRISADNFQDLELIHKIAAAKGKKVDVLLRITPGIECHTHDYIKTGHVDSKFGFDLSQLPVAIDRILEEFRETIVLKGLHAHIGSQIFEVRPYEDLIEVMMNIYYNIREQYSGLVLEDIDLGGGLGITYTGQDDPPAVPDAVTRIAEKLAAYAKRLNYPLPRLLMEPGRSLIATAGLTLYSVGSMKDVPGVRKYVAVDGGMGDNIRPALYQAQYSALVANKVGAPVEETVSIVGKYCESGDILIKGLPVPRLENGDVLVVFGTGAYNYSMASNYNRFPRPAVVLVGNGKAHVLVQRETYDTIIQQDLIPAHLRRVGEASSSLA